MFSQSNPHAEGPSGSKRIPDNQRFDLPWGAAAGSGGAGSFWLEQYLISPMLGSLIHVVEAAAMLIGADAAAGRCFNTPDDTAAAYVATPGIQATPDERAALQQFPLADDSVFAAIERHGPTPRPFLLADLLAKTTTPPNFAMPHPLRQFCRLADGFILSLPVEDACWAALLFLRHRRRPPFVATQREAIRLRRFVIRSSLIRGLLAGNHAPSARKSDRLARLSDTERQVLEQLRQNRTERQAAEALGRSPHTIHVHVKNIYRKLDVRSRQELLALIEDGA